MTDMILNRGDSIIFDVGVVRLNPTTGLNEPVTAQKAWFTAKVNSRDADVDAIIKKDSVSTPTKVLVTAGNVRVFLDPADTAIYKDRWLVYDVQIKEASGSITTVERGKIELKKDVTISTV
jgi:hypothetical protein